MRTSLVRVLSALTLALGLAACGDDGDGDGDGIDASAIDASSVDAAVDAAIDAAQSNALGQPCTFDPDNCPAGNQCVGVGGVGSQTSGWCSPECMAMNTICSTGYTGPAGGMPVCAVTEMQGQPPNLCAIICPAGNNAACPQGLTCQPVNAQTSICAPPP